MRIAAYCLCYKEADWLSLNIKYMYDLIDTFSIVIGPSDKNTITQESDLESIKTLKRLHDPKNKIVIQAHGEWISKDDMTHEATRNLDHDIIVQLDADEFWPHASFKKAITLIKSGADRIAIPHWIFWKNAKYVCGKPTDQDINFHYFVPYRIFRRKENTRLMHFSGQYVDTNTGLVASSIVDAVLDKSEALWHFGWIGNERVKRKFKFYNVGRNVEMPSYENFSTWSLSNQPTVTIATNTVNIKRYRGPRIPLTLRWYIAILTIKDNFVLRLQRLKLVFFR